MKKHTKHLSIDFILNIRDDLHHISRSARKANESYVKTRDPKYLRRAEKLRSNHFQKYHKFYDRFIEKKGKTYKFFFNNFEYTYDIRAVYEIIWDFLDVFNYSKMTLPPGRPKVIFSQELLNDVYTTCRRYANLQSLYLKRLVKECRYVNNEAERKKWLKQRFPDDVQKLGLSDIYEKFLETERISVKKLAYKMMSKFIGLSPSHLEQRVLPKVIKTSKLPLTKTPSKSK